MSIIINDADVYFRTYELLSKCVEWYANESTAPDRARDTLIKIRELKQGEVMAKKPVKKKPTKKGC